MKLRLPNKLQAALMAALASVSFTTLSSGTLSAAFFFGSQAFAEEAADNTGATIDIGDTNLDPQAAIDEEEGKGEAKEPGSAPINQAGFNGIYGSSDDFDRQSTAEAATEASIDTENGGTAGQANYTGTSADLPSDDLGFTSNPYASGSSNGSVVDSPVPSFTQAPQIAPTGGYSAAGIGSGSSTSNETTTSPVSVFGNIGSGLGAFGASSVRLAAPVSVSSPATLGDAGSSAASPITTLGNIMYIGDSITNGHGGRISWRWDMFKLLTDNGVTQVEEGIRTGRNGDSSDHVGATYGGSTFANLHSAHSSGRAYEVSGRNSKGQYDRSNIKNWLGQSVTKTDSQPYTGNVYSNTAPNATGGAPDTFVMMIGINDYLSDDFSDEYVVHHNLLGYNKATESFDGTLASGSGTCDYDVIYNSMHTANPDAVIYISKLTPEGSSGNRSSEKYVSALNNFNDLLVLWAAEKNAKDGQHIVVLDPNAGLVDVTNSLVGTTSGTVVPGLGNPAFFDDGLHPSVQGELIISGNIAKGMGLGGRTAGQYRKAATDFSQQISAVPEGATNVSMSGNSLDFGAAEASSATFAWDSADLSHGSTVEFSLLLGNGETGGWDTTTDFAITLDDGSHAGTLNINEAYIKWGSKLLYSQDASLQGNDAIRIAYVNGNAAESLDGGFYVWLGDMMIGEALSSSSSTAAGVTMSYSGSGTALVSSLAMEGTGSFAPNTSRSYNADYAFISAGNLDTKNTSQGIKEVESWTLLSDRTYANAPGSWDRSASVSDSRTYTGAVRSTTVTGDIDVRYSGNDNTGACDGVIAVYENNATVTGNVYLQFDAPNAIYKHWTGGGGMAEASASLVGTYNGAINGSFTAVINAGSFDSSVYGGAYTGNTSITGGTNVYINDGHFAGNIFGGGRTGSIQNSSRVTITGGSITGSVYGGGSGGTITGGTFVTVTGGYIAGNVYGGMAGETDGHYTGSVTVQDNLAVIQGNIYAAEVTFKGISTGTSKYGPAHYAGQIHATDTFNLDNYTASDIRAAIVTKNLVLKNGTKTTIRDLTLTACTITVEDTSEGTIAGTLALGNTATYTGNLTLQDGLVIDMVGSGSGSVYSDGENGFIVGGEVTVMQRGTSGTLTLDTAKLTGAGVLAGSTFTYDATSGALTAAVQGETDTYYVNTGTVVYGGSKSAKDITTAVTVEMRPTAGATLELAENLSAACTGGIVVASGAVGANIKIDSPVTLNASQLHANAAVALQGNGTYKLADGTRVLTSNISLGADWAGAVELSGNIAGGHTFQNISNNNSFVKLAGVNTWIQSGGTVAANLILAGDDNGSKTGAALMINGADNGKTYTFSGKVKGDGDIAYTQGGGTTDPRTSVFKFTGNISQWTGDFVNYNGNATGNHPSLRLEGSGAVVMGGGIVQRSGGALDVYLGGNNTSSVAVNGNVVNEGGALKLNINSDTTFGANVIGINGLTVASGHHATFNGTTGISGTSSIGGTIYNYGDMELAGTVTLGGSDTSAFDLYSEGQNTYSGKNDFEGSGFVVSGQYYLVKNAEGGTVNTSGATFYDAEHATITPDVLSDGSLVFTSGTQGTVYYVNKDLSYNAGEMGTATSFVVAADKTFTASGANFNGRGLVLNSGSTLKNSATTYFAQSQIAALRLNGNATVNLDGKRISVQTGGTNYSPVEIALNGHTLNITGSGGENDYFGIVGNCTVDSGTIALNGNKFMVGHNNKGGLTVSAPDTLMTMTSGSSLVLAAGNSISLKALNMVGSGNASIAIDGTSAAGNLTLTPDADQQYTFRGTANLSSLTLNGEGTQVLDLTGASQLGAVAVNSGTLVLNATNFNGTISQAPGASITLYGTVATQVADSNARIEVVKKTDQNLTLKEGSGQSIAKVTMVNGNSTWLFAQAIGENEKGLYTDIDLAATTGSQKGLIINTANTTAHIGSLSGVSGTDVRGDYGTGAGRALVVHQNDDTTFAGTFLNCSDRSVSLTKYGKGTLTLTGANVSTQALTVNEGAVAFSGSGAWAGAIIVNDGGTVQLAQGFTVSNAVSGAGNITYGGSANGTLNFGGNDISGWTGSFNNTGSATATLNITRNNGHVKAAIGNEQGGTINITSVNDVFFDNVVNINDISHNTSHTLYIGTDSAKGLTGEMTVTGHASTGRLVVGNNTTDSAAVFTLSGENARLSNSSDSSNHTYENVVQGYGTFVVADGATQTLSKLNETNKAFHGTLKATGGNSVLTLNSALADDASLLATDGGKVELGTAVNSLGTLTVESTGILKLSEKDSAAVSANTITLASGAILDLANITGATGTESITLATTSNGISGDLTGVTLSNWTDPTGYTSSLVAQDNNLVLTFTPEYDGLIWDGGPGTWNVENTAHWHKAGESAGTSKFAQNSDVRFEAGESTVTLGENITAGTMTLEKDAVVKVNMNNHTLSGTLAGEGTYDLLAGRSLGDLQMSNDWTGAVRIKDRPDRGSDSIWMNNLSTERSWLELSGFDGYDRSWASTAGWGDLTANIRLLDSETEPAWKFDANSSTGKYTMNATGKWEGSGEFRFTGGNWEGVKFTGDISGWEGKLTNAGSGQRVVTFAGSAGTVKAAIDNTSTGTLNVIVGDGSNSFAATFTNTVNASSLSVTNNATATLKGQTVVGAIGGPGTVIVENGGTLTLTSANPSFTGDLRVAAGGTLGFSGIDQLNAANITVESGAAFDLARISPAEACEITLATATDTLTGPEDWDGIGLKHAGGISDYKYTLGSSQDGKSIVLTLVASDFLIWDGGSNSWDKGEIPHWHDTSGGTLSTKTYQDGDWVRFDTTSSGSGATATLGDDVHPGRVKIDSGVTVNLDTNNHSFVADGVSGAGTLVKRGTGNAELGGYVSLAGLTVQNGTVTVNADVDSASSVGTLSIDTNGTAVVKNATATLSSGGQSIKGSLTVGEGAIVSVGGNDSWNYSAGSDITVTVDGGTLAFGNKRWTVHSHNKLVLHNATVTGAGDGQNGALDFDGGSNSLTSSGTSVVSANIRFRNNTTELAVTDGTLTLSGTLNGGGGIKKTGTGTMNITGSNTYSGSTTVSAGTLNANAPNALGTGSITVNGGAALNLNAGMTNIGSVTLNSGSTTKLAGEDMLTLASDQSMTLKSGSTLDLTSLGILTKGCDYTLATGSFNLEDGVEYTLRNIGQKDDTCLAVYGDKLLLVFSDDLTWNGGSGVWSYSESVTPWHPDNLPETHVSFAVGDSVTFDGTGEPAVATLKENVSANKVVVNAGESQTTFTGHDVTLHANLLTIMTALTSDVAVEGNATVARDAVWTLTGTTSEDNYTLNAIVGGEGRLVKTGANTVTLSGTNTYSGGTTVSDGTLVATNAQALGAGAVTMAEGTELDLQFSQAADFSNSVSGENAEIKVTGTGQVTITNGANVNVGKTTLESGNLQIKGGKTLYSGDVYINHGRQLTLTPSDTGKKYDSADAAQVNGKVHFTGSSNATVYMTDGCVNFAGGVYVDQPGGTATLRGEHDKNHFIQGLHGQDAVVTLARAISSGGKAGYFNLENQQSGDYSGTLNLSNAATADMSGLLVYNAPQGLAHASVNFNGANRAVLAFMENRNSGTFDNNTGKLTGGAFQDGAVAGLDGSNGIVYANMLTVNSSADTIHTYGGVLNIGSLVKVGAGTQALSGDNSSGSFGVSVNEGTLLVSSVGGLGTGAVDVASGATLQFDSSLASAAQTGAITLDADGGAVLAFGGMDSNALSVTGALTLGSGSVLDISRLTLGEDTGRVKLASASSLVIVGEGGVESLTLSGYNGYDLTLEQSGNELWLNYANKTKTLVWGNHKHDGIWLAEDQEVSQENPGQEPNWHRPNDAYVPLGFRNYDRVTFSNTATTSLASDVATGRLEIGSGKTLTVNAQNAGNVYDFNVDDNIEGVKANLVIRGGASETKTSSTTVEGSVALDNLTLDKVHAVIKGHTEVTNTLAVQNDATLTLNSTSSIATLTVNDGMVTLGDKSSINQLNVNNGGNATVSADSTVDGIVLNGGTLTNNASVKMDKGAATGKGKISIASSGTVTGNGYILTNAINLGEDASATLTGGQTIEILAQDGVKGSTGTETLTLGDVTMVASAKKWSISNVESVVLGNQEEPTTTTLRANNAGIDVNSSISGNGKLVVEGTDVVTLNGECSYTGGTEVNSGTLAIGQASALTGSVEVASGASLFVKEGLAVSTGGAVSLADGASLRLGGADDQALTLTEGGGINLHDGAILNLSNVKMLTGSHDYVLATGSTGSIELGKVDMVFARGVHSTSTPIIQTRDTGSGQELVLTYDLYAPNGLIWDGGSSTWDVNKAAHWHAAEGSTGTTKFSTYDDVTFENPAEGVAPSVATMNDDIWVTHMSLQAGTSPEVKNTVTVNTALYDLNVDFLDAEANTGFVKTGQGTANVGIADNAFGADLTVKNGTLDAIFVGGKNGETQDVSSRAVREGGELVVTVGDGVDASNVVFDANSSLSGLNDIVVQKGSTAVFTGTTTITQPGSGHASIIAGEGATINFTGDTTLSDYEITFGGQGSIILGEHTTVQQQTGAHHYVADSVDLRIEKLTMTSENNDYCIAEYATLTIGNLVMATGNNQNYYHAFEYNEDDTVRQNETIETLTLGGSGVKRLASISTGGGGAELSQQCGSFTVNKVVMEAGKESMTLELANCAITTYAGFDEVESFYLGGNRDSDFAGKIRLWDWNTAGTAAKEKDTVMVLNDDVIAARAVIELDNGADNNNFGVGINADNVKVLGFNDASGKGLRSGNDGYIFSGTVGQETNAEYKSDDTARTLELVGGDTYQTTLGLDKNVDLKMSGGGTQKFVGDNSKFDADITVQDGILEFQNTASLTVQDLTLATASTEQDLNSVVIENGANVGTAEVHGTVKAAEAGAAMASNLTLHADSTLDVRSTLTKKPNQYESYKTDYVGGLDMLGNSLTLQSGANLSNADRSALLSMQWGERYELAYNVGSLTLGDYTTSESFGYEQGSKNNIEASQYFQNLQEDDYYLCYSGSGAGPDGKNVGVFYIFKAPEPTTGTLSLLALAALAARRRRK